VVQKEDKMARIEILVEEKSMKELLTIFLPKILSENWILDHNYFIRSYEGKNDLQKNIPSKIRVLSNWTHESTGVIVLQDQDSSDCKVLKGKLQNLCINSGTCQYLIRIVCRELEAWYIGDFKALNNAFPTFKHEQFEKKSKYRNPDLCNASDELKRILPEFQKVSTAKRIAPFINVETNKSESFRQTVSGIKNFFDLIVDKKA
jgi:hypothetical protein